MTPIIPTKPLILRDSREKHGHGWRWNKSTWCAGTKIDVMSEGDYSISGTDKLIVIERKHTYQELISNLISKDPRRRLFEVFKKMSEYKHKFLIIEANFDEIFSPTSYRFLKPRTRKVAPDIILGSLAAAQLLYDIQVIWSGRHGKEIATKLLRKAYEYYLKEIKENDQQPGTISETSASVDDHS